MQNPLDRSDAACATGAVPRGGRQVGSNWLVGAWWRHEGPTWVIIVAIHVGWLVTLAATSVAPVWLTCPLLAVFVAWHAHLQHEIIHGHPTRREWLNDLLGYAPLGLLYPYPLFKRSHLEHHRSPVLSHPDLDPESFYVMPETWARMGPVMRAVRIANNTLLGRFLIGPILSARAVFRTAVRDLAAGERTAWRDWAIHFLLVAGLLWAVSTLTGLPGWLYVVAVAYPGQGLLLVRSFLEHRPAPIADERTAIVEGGRFWALLFLNNNLHVLHHERPGVPWYELPALYAEAREAVRQRNGGYVFRSYGNLALAYLIRPKDSPVFPL